MGRKHTPLDLYRATPADMRQMIQREMRQLKWNNAGFRHRGTNPYGVATKRDTKKPVSFTLTDTKKKKKKLAGTRNSSRYVGRFKRTTRRSADTLLKYQKYGVVHVDEIQGSVDDPNCVYLAHMSYDQLDMIKYATEALVRYLFRVCMKLNCDSIDQEIPGLSYVNAGSTWFVRLMGHQIVDGSLNVLVTHTVVDNDTVATVAATFYNEFVKYSSGFSTTATTGSNDNAVELVKLALFIQDADGATTNAHFQGDIDLRDLRMHYTAKSELKIQNRTLSDTGSSDAENITHNPLSGWMYDFKGIPKSANINMYHLESFLKVATQKGVMLTRAASLSSTIVGGGSFKEPPLPRSWKNCKKASKILLQPGDIKKGVCSVSKKENFIQFLKTTRFQQGNVTDLAVTWGKMPTQMIALEDVINLDQAQKVTCAYEVNRVSGVYFTRVKRSHIIQQKFDQGATYNNLTG